MRVAFSNLAVLAFVQLAFALTVPEVDQKGTALRTAEKSDAGHKTPVQTTSWCVKLVSACQKTCLEKQTGQQEVKFACDRDKVAKEYLFGCHCNGVDRTTAALKKLSGKPSKHIIKPITEIVATKTKYATSYVDPTESITVDTEIGYAYASDSLETSTSTTVLEVSPESTSTTTRTTVTHTPLHTKTVKTTFKTVVPTTIFKTVASSLSTATEVQPVTRLRVALPKSTTNSNARTSTFCASYERSCERRCAKSKFKVTSETCKKEKDGETSDLYQLYCECSHNNVQTQHALNDVPTDDPNITHKFTIAGTSTVYETLVRTRTNPAHLSTITTSVTYTSTFYYEATSTSTSELVETSTITAAEGTQTVTAVKTKTKTAPTSTITSFRGPTSTKKHISTTTMTMLAPLGRIRLDNTDTNVADGWLGINQDSRRYVWSNPDPTTALEIALVKAPQDGPNGPVYAMLDVANNRWIFGEYGGGTTNSDYPDDLASGFEDSYDDCRYTEFIRYRHTIPSPEQAYDQYYLYPFKFFDTEPNTNDPARSFQLQLYGRFMYNDEEYDIGITAVSYHHIKYLGLYSAHTSCYFGNSAYTDVYAYYEPFEEDVTRSRG